nr:MAG TPA: hypothetical protein [Caudoviricetes sp.]
MKKQKNSWPFVNLAFPVCEDSEANWRLTEMADANQDVRCKILG